MEKTEWIKSRALDSGFILAGVATVRRLDEEQARLESWLHHGYHGDMEYMMNHKELRLDPAHLVPGARSVISLGYNYYRPTTEPSEYPKISIYAQGRDYHKIIKKKLKSFWLDIKTHIDPDATGRYFVDSAPVMERQWAQLAGLGWQGKNTLLIHPKIGSYFFLAEIICDIELSPGTSMQDYCGTCTRCIEACPTEAIADTGYELRASECISYLTIESKEDIPERYKSKMDGWVFGCDVCQQVCPWNRFSTPHAEPLFYNHPGYKDWTLAQWTELTEAQFEEEFGGTPLQRAGFKKFKQSVRTVFDEKSKSLDS